MPDEPIKSSQRVLDPNERISEVLFGLIMVLTFTGSLSVAEAGRERGVRERTAPGEPPFVRLWTRREDDEAVGRGMMLMSHIGDPDTWYTSRYAEGPHAEEARVIRKGVIGRILRDRLEQECAADRNRRHGGDQALQQHSIRHPAPRNASGVT